MKGSEEKVLATKKINIVAEGALQGVEPDGVTRHLTERLDPEHWLPLVPDIARLMKTSLTLIGKDLSTIEGSLREKKAGDSFEKYGN